MMSQQFETLSRFNAVANDIRENLRQGKEQVHAAGGEAEQMRTGTLALLELVRAGRAVADAPPDPEAEKIAGVLIERIERAVSARTMDEWDSAAHTAWNSVPDATTTLPTALKEWLDITGPILELGFESLSRAEQQHHEAMIEGFRRGVAQTPGTSLRITEIDGDHLIRDETVLGPEPGEEDDDDHGIGYLTASVGRVLGNDDDRLETEIERLTYLRAGILTQLYGVDYRHQWDALRLAVAMRLTEHAQHDLEVEDVTGHLPSPIEHLGPEHFPALRAQFLIPHSRVLIEGSTYSRSRRGDQSAISLMRALIVVADMAVRAEPYYLPRAQLAASTQHSQPRSLPAASTFLVWHDDAVPVGGDIRILAWLFATDEDGTLYDAVSVTMLHADGTLEVGWCSLHEGDAAPIGRRIADTLHSPHWGRPKALRLPGSPGSAQWKKTLVRSARRARNGAIHGLRTLPEGQPDSPGAEASAT